MKSKARKTDVQRYEDYKRKYELMGKEMYFEFNVDKENGIVSIDNYIPNDEEFRVIEIPPFVSKIDVRWSKYGRKIPMFYDVEQSLKVINKNNRIKDMSCMFYNFLGKELDLSEFDTTGAEDMSNMFDACFSLKELDLSRFNTSKVKNMIGMFNFCMLLKRIRVNMFDTSNVKNMHGMFSSCYNITELDLSNFDTSKVTDMGNMFELCKKLKELNISNFNTSKVKDMSSMFMECMNLRELDLRSFDTSNVKDMSCMFTDCKRIKNIDLSRFKGDSVTLMSSMFAYCCSLECLDMHNFSAYNLSSVESMFYDCKEMREIDLSNMYTYLVKKKNMLEGCIKLEKLTICMVSGDSKKHEEAEGPEYHVPVKAVKKKKSDRMFYKCDCLTEINTEDPDIRDRAHFYLKRDD